MKKVHLGCWHRDFEGFINVDICDMPHIHYKSEINNLSFFDSNSIDYIYCSHALEYYNYEESKKALTEWNRVMKKGAILRIAVPDFDALLEVYNKTGEISSIIGPLYGKMKVNSIDIYHRQVFNFNRLKDILEESGFKKVTRYDWRDTEHAIYDDHSQAYFPHMDKEKGILVSLNVECEKA